MEKFKKKLKKDIIFGAVYCWLHVILLAVFWFFVPEMPGAVNKGFTSGVLTGIATVTISFMIRNIAVLKNEKKLKELYINETDERTKTVEAIAGKTGIKIVLIGLSLAMVVAASFDKVICFTLLGAVLFTVLVMIITNTVYNKKI